jgi:hypothetical protein
MGAICENAYHFHNMHHPFAHSKPPPFLRFFMDFYQIFPPPKSLVTKFCLYSSCAHPYEHPHTHTQPHTHHAHTHNYPHAHTYPHTVRQFPRSKPICSTRKESIISNSFCLFLFVHTEIDFEMFSRFSSPTVDKLMSKSSQILRESKLQVPFCWFAFPELIMKHLRRILERFFDVL